MKNLFSKESDPLFAMNGEGNQENTVEVEEARDFEENDEHEDIESEDSSSDSITIPYRPSDIRIETHPMNFGDLIEMIGAGWINFDTEYQRLKNLWSPDKQSRLIESVLLGLRLPAFYFEEVTRRRWNIIDGLQRCCAIQNFCVYKTMKLSGLEFLGEKFTGKTFDDFPFEIRRDLKMSPITVNILMQGTPADVKYMLFKRLNTGGVNLTPQEIRTAMFPKVVPILRSMAESKAFTRVTDGKISPKRQNDKDFVSRFIAFYLLGRQAYKGNMDIDTFVNEAMVKLQNESENSPVVEKMKADFAHSLEVAQQIFGKDAFRKRMSPNDNRKPLNKAYFEVLTTTFARLNADDEACLLERKDLLKENLMHLMNIPAFETSISTSTGKIGQVNLRFEGVESAVKATLENRKLGDEAC